MARLFLHPKRRFLSYASWCPTKARELYGKAVKAATQQNLTTAKQSLDEAISLYPAFPEALTLRGVIESQLKEWQSAKEDLQNAILFDPTLVPLHIALAEIYNIESRYDESLSVMQRANTQAPETSRGQYEMAWALIGKKQYDQALAVAEDALLHHAGHVQVFHLAKAAALSG